MRTLGLALAIILSAGSVGARPLADGPVLNTLCAVPPGWSPPFTRVYPLRDGGTLVFVAVEHTRDHASSSMAAVKAAVDRYKPATILVEGASAAKSGNESYLRSLAASARERYATGTAQENLYAVKLAADAGIPYRGWDLCPADEYRADLSQGFTAEDVLGVHLLRGQVDPYGPIPIPLLQNELQSIPQDHRPNGFDFARWYRKYYAGAARAQDRTPCGDGIGSRIIAFESTQRTLNLIANLKRAVTPGVTVLVEAGANHWLAMRDYLASIGTGPPS